MAYPQSHDAQALVQQQLAAHGACSPLELLLETNRLDYDVYRAWRRGERATLDGVLIDGARDTRTWVEDVASWAQSLHLNAEIVDLYGIDDNAGAPLTASADTQLDELLHTEFRLAADRVQLDLFLDTTEAAAVDALVEALSAHDATAAQARLQELRRVNAAHWAADEAALLIEALRTAPPCGAAQGLRRLETLERQWLNAACAVLRTGARDFLTPLWRGVGQALEGVPYHPARPRQHSSWAYLNGLDWDNVKRTAQGVDGYRREPALLERLAEAEWRLRDRAAAVALWCLLCWRWPERFEATVDAANFPDHALKTAWLAAQESRTVPAITTEWFPAWLLVAEPGLAGELTPRHGTSDPERAFDLLLALFAGGSDRQDLDNRRALHALHPRLLERYLEAVGA